MAELNPASLLRKTESGQNAIKERDRSLAPRARTLLIMVDGARSVAQLAALNTDAVQGLALLNQLVLSGYVEVLTAEAAPAPAPQLATTAAAAALEPPNRDLKTSIRAATRFLEGMMGPGADAFNLQLEKCTNKSEFEAKVQEITLLLARARSVKKAEEFNAAALGR